MIEEEICMKKLLSSILILYLISSAAFATESIIVQSTTSTANSGLYDYLLPKFKGDAGIDVHVFVIKSVFLS